MPSEPAFLFILEYEEIIYIFGGNVIVNKIFTSGSKKISQNDLDIQVVH